MPKITPLWDSDPVQYLLRARYPDIPDRPLKGNALSLLAKGSAEVATYRAELEALPPAELLDRVETTRLLEIEHLLRQRREAENARPFNQPFAKADFSHWVKCSYWSIDEATALSLSKEPGYATWEHLRDITFISPFAAEFEKRRDILIRAKAMGQLYDLTTPSVFVAWAGRMQIALPPELLKSVQELGVQVADWKTNFDQQKTIADEAQAERAAAVQEHLETLGKSSAHMEKMGNGYRELIKDRDAVIAAYEVKLDALQAQIAELQEASSRGAEKVLGVRERDSLLKLVIGMAVNGYGHDPKAVRNSTAKEIAGDLHRLGIALDEDTVRKYLAEGRDLLPSETEQELIKPNSGRR